MTIYLSQRLKHVASWCLFVVFGAFPAIVHGMPQAEDPWPEWQRTASRLGRTETVGPQTPTLAWRARVDPGPNKILPGASPVIDAGRRVIAGHSVGLTAVDADTGKILWQFFSPDGPGQAASLWGGRVMFGGADPDDLFYCLDAATGEEIWSRPAAPHPNLGNVVGENGVVYYASQLNVLYARRVSDGSEVWTHSDPDFFNSAPALDGLGRLYIGNLDRGQWLAFDTADADILWRFPISSVPAGTSPVEGGRVYVTSAGARKLFCIDAATGQEIWNFNTVVVTPGAAVRHDGVILVIASGDSGWLFAVTPDGQELWRYPITDQAVNRPPIVDGAGNAYFCTFWALTDGWVHAVRPDGTTLWVKEMPDRVAASPAIGPDGTLYVMCEDKYLYAFRDLRGDMNCDATVNAFDIQPFLLALFDAGNYTKQYPDCNILLADVNEDGQINAFDIEPFLELLFGP